MARNMYPGYCYKCGAYVPAGYGHFELIRRKTPEYVGVKWRIQCVKCASGRTVKKTDREVMLAQKKAEARERGKVK